MKRTGLKLGIGVLILLYAMPSQAFLCLLAHAASNRHRHHPRPLVRPAFRQRLPAIMPTPPWRMHPPSARHPVDTKARPVVYRGWVFRNPAN